MLKYSTDLLWKSCTHCSTHKPGFLYPHNTTYTLNRTHICNECHRIKQKETYAANKGHKRKVATDRVKSRKKRAVEMFGGKCQDCSGVFPQCVYDFHHVGGKDMDPYVALTMSWDNAVKELEKCVLLCANCHRIRHFKEDITE